MKQARRVIDFDVAQSLVNYVTREGQHFADIGSGRCPSASDIRTKLCELKDDQNWIDVTVINQWLCDKEDSKMHGAHAIPHLRELIKRSARTKKKPSRYILFAGDDYYADGGSGDYRGTFDTAEAAYEWCLQNYDDLHDASGNWADVVRASDMQSVAYYKFDKSTAIKRNRISKWRNYGHYTEDYHGPELVIEDVL